MPTPTLRGLAKAYAEGRIERRDYILERRRLIDGIVAGEIELVPYGPPAPETPVAPPRDIADGDDTLELPQNALEPRGPRTARLIAIAALALLVLIAAGWVLFARPVPEPPRPAEPALQVPPAVSLLAGFLERNAWQATDTATLLATWAALDTEERARARGHPVMGKMANAIQGRLVEEKALMAVGEPRESLAARRRLLEIAAALGIETPGVRSLEAEWAAAEAAQRAATDRASDPGAAPPTRPAPLPTAPPVLVAPDAAPPTDPSAPVTAATESSASHPSAETSGFDGNSPANPAPAGAAPATPAGAGARVAETPALQSPPAEVARADTEKPGTIPAVRTATTKPATRRATCRASLAKQRKPYCRDLLQSGVRGPVLVVLPAGRFEMGGEKAGEQPVHEVRIDRPFALGLFEVSFEEIERFCIATQTSCPALPWPNKSYPAVDASWALAVAYCEWLSVASGARYRLPTEAEWEYAARAGTRTRYAFGDEILPTHARFSFRTPQTAPLAAGDRSVNRNRFRLYHMLGNVREWVLDAWSDDYTGAPMDGSAHRTAAGAAHVARGGSYADGPAELRSAARARLTNGSHDRQTGFRVVRLVD